MGKRILSLVLILTLMLSTNTSMVFAQAKENSQKKIIQKESYEKNQLDNNTLFEMAKKGNYVNNDYTQVISSYQNNGSTKVTKINKKIGKEVYDNGEIVEDYSVVALFEQVTPEEDGLLTASSTGSQVETGTSGSSTVSIIVGYDYDRQTFDSGTTYCYKITKIYATPVLLDSTFSLTKLYQYCAGTGVGYTSSGSPTYVNFTEKSYTITNPTSSTKYSLSTGYTEYLQITDGSGFGSTATLTYKRISTGTTYTFSYQIYR